MSSKEDQIIDETVVKETTSEDHSLRVSMENLRPRDDGHHTRGSQSRRFENGHFMMIDSLETGNVGTVKLLSKGGTEDPRFICQLTCILI